MVLALPLGALCGGKLPGNNWINVYKSAAGTTNAVAAKSGSYIVVKSIIINGTNSGRIYFGYGTDTALTKISPHMSWNTASCPTKLDNLGWIVPAGNELDVWTSIASGTGTEISIDWSYVAQ